MSLTDYEINLILTWSTNCVLTSKTTRDENPDVHPSVAAINNPTGAAFKIADTNCTSQLLLYELKMTKHF